MARIAKGTTIDDAKTGHNEGRVDFTGCIPSECHVDLTICGCKGYFKALFNDKGARSDGCQIEGNCRAASLRYINSLPAVRLTALTVSANCCELASPLRRHVRGILALRHNPDSPRLSVVQVTGRGGTVSMAGVGPISPWPLRDDPDCGARRPDRQPSSCRQLAESLNETAQSLASGALPAERSARSSHSIRRG